MGKLVEMPVKGYNEETVRLLEHLLERAKAGDFTSFIGTLECKGEYFHYHSGCDNVFELIGVLERQKFVCMRRVEGEGDEE